MITCFLVAILRSDKALQMSVLHRAMKADFNRMRQTLGLNVASCVSYSQLKRIIRTIGYERFNAINDVYFGSIVSGEGSNWKTLDGKELRGSIDGIEGQKRGQNIVNMISHSNLQSSIIGEYDGSKASEKPIVAAYLAAQLPGSCPSFTFDALHTSIQNLTLISQKGGLYLAQIKKNQRVLLEDCKDLVCYQDCIAQGKEIQKGHGRVDERKYEAYKIDIEDIHPRWATTQAVTLLVVERKRYTPKTGKESKEIAYWISNQTVDGEEFNELTRAIRNHWAIEVHHYQRDVQWGEDKMIMRNKGEAKVVASFITVATNLFQNKGPNTSELREKITKDWKMVNALLKPK